MQQEIFPSGLPDPHFHPDYYADVTSKRCFAWLIDVIVVSILTALVVVMTLFLTILFAPLIFIVIDFFYRSLGLAGKSATLGMRIMAVEIRTYDGNRLTPGLAAMHTLVFYASTASFLVQLASIFLMITSPTGQGIGDRLLGVVGINRPAR